MFKANNIHYELSERTRGIGVGGIGAVHKLALASGLVEAIDEKVECPESFICPTTSRIMC